jgi:hypothetical protein
VKSISNGVLKADVDWHFPKLGQRSVDSVTDSFPTDFCQKPARPVHFICSCVTLRYHVRSVLASLQLVRIRVSQPNACSSTLNWLSSP